MAPRFITIPHKINLHNIQVQVQLLQYNNHIILNQTSVAINAAFEETISTRTELDFGVVPVVATSRIYIGMLTATKEVVVGASKSALEM